MKKHFISLAVLLLAMTACTKDEEATENFGENTPVNFTADIAGQQDTRAYNQTWENGDQIGISGTSGDAVYTNVAYETTDGSGNFSIAPGSTKIYYRTTDDVIFTTYYPWNELEAGATTIAANTWEQSQQKNFDFLWARALGSKSLRNVAFSFTHRMAKLSLTIEAGTNVDYNEMKAAPLMLGDYLYTGSFDVTTGMAAADRETSAIYYQFANNGEDESIYNAPFTLNNDEQTVTYSLILFPQSFEDASGMTFEAVLSKTLSTKLDFTTANRDAGDTDPKNELVAGRQYNLTIALNKRNMTMAGCTTSGWVPTNGGEFIAGTTN